MSKFHTFLPDGTRVDFEANSKEEALQMKEQALADYEAQQQQAPSQRLEPSRLESGIRGATQGATFGFGDELSGLAGATMESLMGDGSETFSDLYNLYRGSQREQNLEAQQANPWTYGLSEFAGGFAVPGMGAVKAAPMLKNLPKIGSSIRPTGRLALAGAGAGGVAGAGYSEGETPGEIATDTAIGAGIGGALSPVAAWGGSKVGEVGANVMGGIKNRLYREPERTASYRVRQALENDGFETAEQVMNRLDEMGPEGRLADIGENLREEAVAATKVPGPGRRLGTEFTTRRSGGAEGRLAKATEDWLDPKWRDFRGFISDLTNSRKRQSTEAYNEAYSQSIQPTPEMNRISMTPAFQRAAKEAQETIGNELDAVSRSAGLQPDGSISTEFADLIGRRLQDMANKAYRAGENNAGRQITNIKKAFDRELYNQNPALQRARNIFSGAKDLEEAATAGRELLFGKKTYMDDLEAMLDDFTEGQEEAFRVGLMRGIWDKLSEAGETHDTAKRLFNSTRVQRLLSAAVDGDVEGFNKFMNSARAEGQFQKTYGRVTGGSPTQPQQKTVEGVPVNKPQILQWVQKMLRDMGAQDAHMTELTQEDWGEVAKYLFEEADLETVRKIMNPGVRGRVNPITSEGRLAAPTGVATTQALIGEL